MITNHLSLNVLLLNSKKNLTFLDKCVVDSRGVDIVYTCESDLLDDIRLHCKNNGARIINSFTDVSLPTLFPYQKQMQTYKIDVDNYTYKTFKINAMVLYIVRDNGTAEIVNRLSSEVDHFTIDKNSITTLLLSIDNTFQVLSVKQLYGVDKARISVVGARHPILFAYSKMDMSTQEISIRLHNKLMGHKNIIGYKSTSDILKRIYRVVGKNTLPVQDLIPLDIAYDMNKKHFLISKYKPTIKPVWFNVMVEIGLRGDNKLEVTSILTADRIIIPDIGTLYIHSPSNI